MASFKSRDTEPLPDLGCDPLFSSPNLELYGSGTTCEGLQGLETYDVPQFVPLKPSIPAPPIPCKNPFSLEREPGKYKFSLVCKRHTYSSEINTLFIHMQTNFAVEFELEDAVTPNESMSFRVLVTYSDLADVAKLGPVQPCSCNAHVKSRKSEYGNNFIISHHQNAKFFTAADGHTTLSLKVADMEVVKGKYTGIFSFASYTSCLVAKGTKIATIFTLVDGDMEVGRDFFFVNVCACPSRDMTKEVQKSQSLARYQRRKPRKRRSVSTDEPASDPMTSSSASSSISSPFSSRGQPQQHASPDADSDQYYVFQWRLKDREMFEHLCGIKRRFQELEEQQRQNHHL